MVYVASGGFMVSATVPPPPPPVVDEAIFITSEPFDFIDNTQLDWIA